MAGHILIVEDEQKIAALLQDYLEKAGYSTSVLSRGDQVLAWLKRNPSDLMLLDIMLPGMDGIEVCREARKFSTLPIIMITAKVEEVDRLIGLEIGADDYVCKPFSPREVVARVKSVLRRTHQEAAGKQLVVGPLVLDENTHQVKVRGGELDLTPSEFRLLQVLMSKPGRVFSRDELLVRAQGYDCEGYDRTIDSHIKNLRKKIAPHLPDQEVINTVYGIGYKFSVPDTPDRTGGNDS